MDTCTYKELAEAVTNLEEVVALAITNPGLMFKECAEDRLRNRQRVCKLQRRLNHIQQLLNFVANH
jgi:hypothetical protein